MIKFLMISKYCNSFAEIIYIDNQRDVSQKRLQSSKFFQGNCQNVHKCLFIQDLYHLIISMWLLYAHAKPCTYPYTNLPVQSNHLNVDTKNLIAQYVFLIYNQLY